MDITVLNNLVSWITTSLVYGAIIMYAALGETFTQKAGNLNLGTPGIMAIGAIASFATAYKYEIAAAKAGVEPNKLLCLILPFAAAILASMLAGLLYTFLTVTLRANQNVTGLTLTIFGVGLAKFIGRFLSEKTDIAAPVTYTVFSKNIQTATNQKLGTFGQLFLSYGFLFYLSIVLAIVSGILLFRTRAGLNLRAIGENPGAADAVGINVTKYKYLAIVGGSAITGLGGAYYVLDFGVGIWSTAAAADIEALGWLAVALVIFATWKPLHLIWGSYIFGLCFWAYQYLPGVLKINVNRDLAQMLPYIVTIIVLVIGSFRKKRENQPPAALGLPYFREER